MDSLAFTWCQVPFVLHRHGGYAVRVTLAVGRAEAFDEPSLSIELSAEIFGRTGAVRLVKVQLTG